MAKHCKVCNNSYPDTEEHCPHCAAATTQIAGSDSAVLAAGTAEPVPVEEDSSAVNLGEPVVADLASPSGESNESWAALVADAGDSAVGGEPFVAEVASGVELPGATVSETPSAHLPGAASDSAVGGEPFIAEVASSSGKLAGGPYVAEVEDEASRINLGELATGAAGSEGSVSGEAMLADEAAEVEAGSAVNLGETVRPTDRPSSRDLIAEAVESGVDLADKRRKEQDAEDVADAVVAEEGDSAIELSPSARAPSPSSAPEAVPERRRVPPGSESDIDLDAEEAAERIDLTARTEDESAVPEAAGPGPASSGVDLGGLAGRPPKRLLGESSSSAVEVGHDAAEDEEAAAAAALAGDDEAAASSSSVKSRTKKVAVDEEEDEDAAPASAKAKKKAKDEEEEEEEAAAKKPKTRSGCGSLVGVGVLGLLIGAVVPIALAMFNVVDAGKELGSLVGLNPKTNAPVGPANVNPGGPKQPVVAPPTVADAGQHLKNGDFAKAMEGLGSAGDTAEVQGQRGTARWMNYLEEQMAKGAKPNGADESVKKARAELEAAKDDPEAILALGNLEEYTAGPAAALKTYQDAAKKFAGKPWARVFQAQIDRLDSTSARPADAGKPQAAAPRPGDGDISARALALLLIAFQPAGGATGDKGPEEAGFDFWAAVKLAQAGKYPDAIKELDAARTAHDKLRFSRLRKAQNPLSDPTEEIFLRAAEEIKAYWTLQNSLAQQGIAGRTPAEIQKSLEALKQGATAGAQMEAVAKKLNTTPAKAAGAIDTLIKARDDAAKLAGTLDAQLTTAKKDADAAKKLAKDTGDKLALTETQLKGSEAKLKAVNDRLVAAGVKDADPAKGIDALAADRATADKALDAIVAKVALAHVKVDRKDVLKGVNSVVEAALVNDPKGELMASREEIRRLGGALNQRHTPEQMLDIWMPIIADRGHKNDAAKATVDANRVRADDRATPLGKKKAAAVLGLAKRDQGDLEGARALLTEALAGSGPKAAWQAPAAQALKELTDPRAYYLPRVRELYEDGKYQEAMHTIAEARKLFPKDAGNLQALSGLVQLDMAREKGKLDPASPAVIEAKKDATAAAAAGSAEGNYVLGRINEELGNLAEAKAAYAKALAAHGVNDATGARYRLALARVLKLQGEKPAGGHAAATLRSLPVADMKRQPLLTLVLLVELGMQPGAGADQDEATRLLREVENTKDGPDTFMLKAQALALRGLWTPALKTYAAGLRPHLRRDYANGLADLIDRTPALRRPAAMDPPNPLLADASYASGLRNYFARRYGDAEEAFLKAIEYDNQDARYFYFLGLSRLALNKTTDAEADFHEGAQLELLNRPGREAVSTALERVQGAARQAVNRARP